MINGGFGETHLNVLLAVLNIPGISKRGLKEREVGNTLSKMADESLPKESLRGGWKVNSFSLSKSFESIESYSKKNLKQDKFLFFL